jgi:hypothetical protein
MAAGCDECRSIMQELSAAYREALASPEIRDALIACRKMIGGTESDVVDAEDAFAKARGKSSPRIRNAISRMYAHMVRTGHRLPNLASLK